LLHLDVNAKMILISVQNVEHNIRFCERVPLVGMLLVVW